MATIRRKDNDDSDKNEGQKRFDEQAKRLESRLKALYSDAVTDMNGKLEKHLKDYAVKNQNKLNLLKQGKITKQQYEQWKAGQAFIGNKILYQIDGLSTDLTHIDEIATAMINGQLPDFYTLGYNFTGFQAEMLASAASIPYTSFTIFNTDAVAFLTKSIPTLLPTSKINIPKDLQWNKQHIATAITQGIIQGESTDQIAERLRQVTTMDYNASIRNARTATGAALNQGKYDAAQRIKAEGVPLTQTWNAVRDDRTRDNHLLLNGTHPDKNGLFGADFLRVPLRFPKDPQGAPEDVYNCRCTLDNALFDSGTVVEYQAWLHDEFYEDWVAVKASEAKNGKDVQRMNAIERENFLKGMYVHLHLKR